MFDDKFVLNFKTTIMKLIKLFVFLITINVFAQEVPRVKLADSSFLSLRELNVKTEIVGNIATTTYTMNFYNATNRVLEGELAFPLGQGQSVTNFSMDVNGRMRDAVIVEKELGRVAYETTIRQKIDPGLLVMTKGNNYKARVYPIPSNGYKKLSITFEQEMRASEGKHLYEIPFNFQDPLDFSLEVLVYNTKLKPKITGENNLKFEEKEGLLKAYEKRPNALVNKSIHIELPIGKVENVTTYNNYFNVYKSFEPQARIKEKPNNITIYWDASYSMEYRNLEKEFELLDNYFDYLENVNVDFITFSNTVSNPMQFNVKNGNWKELKRKMETVTYDGGTSYLDIKKTSNHEVLFFSDGMFNLGELQHSFKGNFYAINSVKSANHEFLEYVSNSYKGKYINLNIMSVKDALETIENEAFKFMGITNNTDVYEVYPLINTTVNNDFSVSGKFNQDTELELNFGYGNEITNSFKVQLKNSNFNGLVKRIWAKKKLQALNINKEENKEAIIDLAKRHHLISDYTSLIILDRIEDYVRYEIEPPGELKSEYKDLIAKREQAEKKRIKEIGFRRKELLKDYKELMNWYNTDYPKVVKRTKTSETASSSQTNAVTQVIPNVEQPTRQTISSTQNNQPQSPLNLNERIISGKVVSTSDDLPLPGVNVIVQGTSRGVQTDFDGNYSINAITGEELVFSFLGMIEDRVIVAANNTINVVLNEDGTTLEQVVVVGFSSRSRDELTSAVSNVTSEDLQKITPSVSIDNMLQGVAHGVQVTAQNGKPGQTAHVRIRGVGSINAGNTPLYIVDGVQLNENEINTINPDDLHSVSVLSDVATTSIYGARGSNGVILITTKDGLKNSSNQMEELKTELNKATNFTPWTPNNDNLKILGAQNTNEDAYEKYLELRIRYRNTPSFFIDVADYFDSRQEKELAVKILSNLAEIDLDNHEVLRAFAYKLEYFQKYDLMLFVCKEILKLRPEEPQSTRDLALAYEYAGEYQKAFDLLYTLIDGQLVEKDLSDRFYGIEHLAFIEACHLLQKHKHKIEVNSAQKKLIKPIQIDLRIVADWNHSDTDLDLWVDNPENQIISYRNKSTDYGDRLSEDMTDGYGPEEFMIKKGLRGEYKLDIDYFGDDIQKISGPTTLKITIFKNYGRKNETKEVRVYRLDAKEDLLEIGYVTF